MNKFKRISLASIAALTLSACGIASAAADLTINVDNSRGASDSVMQINGFCTNIKLPGVPSGITPAGGTNSVDVPQVLLLGVCGKSLQCDVTLYDGDKCNTKPTASFHVDGNLVGKSGKSFSDQLPLDNSEMTIGANSDNTVLSVVYKK